MHWGLGVVVKSFVSTFETHEVHLRGARARSKLCFIHKHETLLLAAVAPLMPLGSPISEQAV